MKSSRGFTMIELVLVIAIMALLLPAVFGLFIANLRAQTKVLILQEVKQNGDTALNTMETLIKARAKRIELSDSSEACSTSGSSYTGNIYFIDENGNSFTFENASNRIASQSAQTYYLTANSVSVTDLVISCERNSIFAPPLMTVSFDIQQANASTRAEESANLHYQTKIRLRSL